MRKLTIRKAFKASCELRERTLSAVNCLKTSTNYDVFDKLGNLEEVVSDLQTKVAGELSRNLAGVKLSQSLRNRIQVANNRPLEYAGNKSINDLIAEQSTLKVLIDWYPEEKDIKVTDVRDLQIRADSARETLSDKTNAYRTSTNSRLAVSGITTDLRASLVEERLGLRAELDSVTGQLAYANITETVELADEEAEILRSLQIPV